ncbi:MULTISPECIES: hypothetical protein [Thalassospira]|uniref:Uncharacterized protein n=1 Tax=Thalassospira tepidiphila TaxID=393657 RepID=A0ABX0X352_9PROT|nr:MULTISPECIES: hypothetical protein [Thalassospira]MBO6581006.1 hypothetical protein [Thalassospira sp.]MBO6804828.1 hypothetical protein [Thalassospira sp.]MBO6820512.1 hypothetical protein [Thalassospira sp.]MBO6889977.1 hypothetical protein [Thalassospira sp.]NJB76051.1 hypothetical protein [Thalassospira tepidiphila]
MIRVRSVVVDLFNEHMQCMVGCIHSAQAARERANTKLAEMSLPQSRQTRNGKKMPGWYIRRDETEAKSP